MAILDSTIVNGDLSVNGNLNAPGTLPQGLKLKYIGETSGTLVSVSSMLGASLATLYPQNKVWLLEPVRGTYGNTTTVYTRMDKDSSSGSVGIWSGTPMFFTIYTFKKTYTRYGLISFDAFFNIQGAGYDGNVGTLVVGETPYLYNGRIYEVIG